MGAAIEQLAKKAQNVFSYPLKQFPFARKADFNFMAIRNMYLTQITKSEEIGDISAFCASVQFSIAAHMCRKLHSALDHLKEKHCLEHLVISGGVASNQYIFNAVNKLAKFYGLRTIVPPPSLCTDNAAMIASAAWKMIEHRLVDFQVSSLTFIQVTRRDTVLITPC
ncbi:hypothetical protein L596_011216 [Steinernema carpocapsae]|uniref:Gcp-like domain-containing protein n=1 Tax=Steinernema carpocapsae TaxID=34508 RepID=A0A4U5NTP5_STECR|nr:hypothetical protein L596_011216 [Steinernema carpocapsae]